MPTLQNIVVYEIVLYSLWCAAWLWRRDVFRPGSLVRLEAARGLRNPAVVSAAAWMGAALATFLAAAVGGGIAGSMLGAWREPGVPPDPATAALMDVAAYVLAAIVGFLCAGLLARNAREAGAPARGVGLEARAADIWPGLGALAVVLPLCVTAGVLIAMAAKLVQAEPERVAHSALRDIVANRYDWHAWVKSLMAIMGASVMEELVYRVFLQSAIISAFARLRAARTGQAPVARPPDVFWGITLSTAAFVLPHAGVLGGPANWNALPSLTILGIGLGVLYERSRSPLAVIAMHAGFNAVNIVAALATSPPAAPAGG